MIDFVSPLAVDLDGRQINETERQFLMNWKAMRVARRKMHRADTLAEQMESVAMAHGKSHKNSTSKLRMPQSAMPLTLPALPARQLPRRNKRAPHHHQETEHHPADYRAMMFPGYSAAQMISKDISEGLRLPQLVPDRGPSLAAQRSSTVRDPSLPVLQHQPLLSSVGWKPVHATGLIHNRFM